MLLKLFMSGLFIIITLGCGHTQTLNPEVDMAGYDLVFYSIESIHPDTVLASGDTMKISFYAPTEFLSYDQQPDPVFRGTRTGDSVYVFIDNSNVDYSEEMAGTNIIEVPISSGFYEITMRGMGLSGLRSKYCTGKLIHILIPPNVIGNITIIIK